MKAQAIAAAGLLFALGVNAQRTIYNGTGFGTYYYDVERVSACDSDFSLQNEGPVECSLSTLSLSQVNSEYLVAINHSQLIGDMSTYCGKRVVVSVGGVPSSLPLFIGDGCRRCGIGPASSDIWDPNGAPGLDFSYSVLSQLSANACTDGHIPIGWKIVDETLYDFDTNALGSGDGRVAESGRNSWTTTTSPNSAVQSNDRTPPLCLTSMSEQSSPVTAMSVACIIASTDSLTVPSQLSTIPCPMNNNPSLPCATGTWQCNTTTLEQCLEGSWIPRVTCGVGFACEGGNAPYCAPFVLN